MRYDYSAFVVGEVLELGTVVIEKDEMLAFARRFDPQPFHVDPVAAENSLLGGLCASGWYTASLWMRAWVDAVLLDSTSQGSPGGRELAWPAPVFPGDELTFRGEIVSARTSSSRPTLGIVEVTGTGHRGDDLVLKMTFSAFFGR
jgi:acyl dehydratase